MFGEVQRIGQGRSLSAFLFALRSYRVAISGESPGTRENPKKFLAGTPSYFLLLPTLPFHRRSSPSKARFSIVILIPLLQELQYSMFFL